MRKLMEMAGVKKINESIGAPQQDTDVPVEDWEVDLIDPETGEYYDDIEEAFDYQNDDDKLLDEMDLQNGYDKGHQIDGDDYGFDNDESTTDMKDGNPKSVRMVKEYLQDEDEAQMESMAWLMDAKEVDEVFDADTAPEEQVAEVEGDEDQEEHDELHESIHNNLRDAYSDFLKR